LIIDFITEHLTKEFSNEFGDGLEVIIVDLKHPIVFRHCDDQFNEMISSINVNNQTVIISYMGSVNRCIFYKDLSIDNLLSVLKEIEENRFIFSSLISIP
jgi:hypothetical protein